MAEKEVRDYLRRKLCERVMHCEVKYLCVKYVFKMLISHNIKTTRLMLCTDLTRCTSGGAL